MADDLMTGGNQDDPGTDPKTADPSAGGSPDPKTAETGAGDSAPKEGTPGEGGEKDPAKEGEQKPVEGAPEEYGDFAMPEGVAMDEARLAEFLPIAKELNLTQEQAQKLVDMEATRAKQQMEGAVKFYEDRDKAWAADLKADKEVGGDKLEANAVKVNRLLQTFDTDGKLVGLMAENRLQGCAPLFAVLARISSHFSEDVLVGGNDKTGKGDKPSYMSMGYKPVDEY